MPTLKNAKHEVFAQNFVKGMGVHEAYISAGYSGSHQSANAVRSNPNVERRIKELLDRRAMIEEKATEKAIQKTSLSKEWVLEHLILNVQRAMQIIPPTKDGGMFRYEGSVANKALELLGKECGMFIDRKEVGTPGEFAELDAEGLREAIAERITMVRQGDGSFAVPGGEGSGGKESG